MPDGATTIRETATGSAEASIAVLLVLAFGYYAQHIGWIDVDGEKQISDLCVTVFLPALLFTQIAPQATASNLLDYGIIVILSIFAMLVSYLIGAASRRFFKAPRWTEAAFIFNNATSLPLLLLESLDKTGTIRLIIGKNGGSVADAVSRGRTYLLIAALVANVGRFATGPEIMNPGNGNGNGTSNGHGSSERTPLLPGARVESSTVKRASRRIWAWVSGVLNPPLIAALVAVFFGLIPPLRHAFFDRGKFLNATVIQSINYMGKLYTALQLFVLGSKLRSKEGSKLPIGSTIVLFIHRFFLMPAIMIAIVYLLRTHWPSYAERDPMLDFVLTMVGVGPPAITLAAVSEMARLDAHEDSQVARLLTVSYLVTPLICIPLSASVYVVQHLGLAK